MPRDIPSHSCCRVVFGGLLLATTCLAADEPTKTAWSYAPELLRPFWLGTTMDGESVLFIKDATTGEARAAVLFPIQKVLAVRNSAGDVTYEEGRDFTWKPESRQLVLPTGSRIPSRTPQDLRRPAKSQPYQLTHRDGEILFGAKLEYHDMQTCITYTHAPHLWNSPVPAFDPKALPRTIARLRAKQPATIAVLGDSISTGANASGVGNAPPFQPGYPELLQRHLQARYGGKVELKNLSVGGKDTNWAMSMVDKVVEARPDLVVLAFGMNDSAGRPAKEFQSFTQTTITKIREKLPESEFILVAGMLGNKDWIRLKQELFPEYRDALAKLCGPGIALADVTAVWAAMLKRKQDWDQTGNGVNHPNDFGHRVYAQVISTLLVPETESTQ
jgi:acyl-CoA thioesterase-1